MCVCYCKTPHVFSHSQSSSYQCVKTSCLCYYCSLTLMWIHPIPVRSAQTCCGSGSESMNAEDVVVVAAVTSVSGGLLAAAVENKLTATQTHRKQCEDVHATSFLTTHTTQETSLPPFLFDSIFFVSIYSIVSFLSPPTES